jgi:hypothetical protein
MCSLYDVAKSTVSEHLSKIFTSGELDENSVVRNFRTTAADGEYKKYRVIQDKLFESDYDRFAALEEVVGKVEES